MRSKLGLTLAAGTLALLPAACGSSNDDNSSKSSGGKTAATKSTPAASASALRVEADPSGKLAFTQTKLTGKSGTVSIAMQNPSSSGLPHGIAVEGKGVDKDGPTVGPGKTARLAVSLKPGTYEFYCPVPGHKQAGMKGTLVVQ
jgi:plastocyanin